MKFSCDRSVLLKEVAIANEIIASKNAISILSNIYLKTDGDSLVIKATDMKVNFETAVPVDVKEPGEVTILSDKFFQILSSYPDGEIEFENADNKTTVKTTAKRTLHHLKSTTTDKYPEFTVSGSGFFEMPVKDFKEMISETVFAVSDDETRYYMNGVFLEKVDGKLNMVATDGRRLAFIGKDLGDEIKDFPGVIIPSKILTVVNKRAGDEGMISISVTDKIIFVQFGSYKLSSILLEGQFPSYRKVIPESQSYKFVVERLKMLEALKSATIINEKNVRVYFSVTEGSIGVYGEENDQGDGREDFACEYSGEPVDMALNPRYIEEPFKVMTCDKVGIHFTDPAKAITIKPEPEQDFFHIVMPMQID